MGFFWDYSQTAIYEAAHKQDIFDGVSVENDITSGKLGIEVSVNVHRNPSLAEVTGRGLWISMSDISEAVFIKKKKKILQEPYCVVFEETSTNSVAFANSFAVLSLSRHLPGFCLNFCFN